MNIERKLIPGIPQRKTAANRYVVAHESGNAQNTGPEALDKEVSYMTGNWRNAFTSHWVGGGGRIVQLSNTGIIQNGCGPKGNPYSFAQVELARTKDPAQFKKDYAAYIWLLRELAKEAGIPVQLDGSGNGIKSHNWVRQNLGGTTHSDPFSYLASFGISKAQFAADIKNGVSTAGVQTGSSTPAAGAWSVSYGDRGPRVLELQQALNKLGYKLATDGSFGPSVKSALLDWQKKTGLAADGSYGPASQAAMTKALKEKEVKPVANEKDAAASKSLAAEVERAKKIGLTDGTYLHRAATREEVAAMMVRTYDAVLKAAKEGK